MNVNAQTEKLAMLVAEEVLQTLYGDDLRGCTVNPETIANIISQAIKQSAAKDQALLDLYQKVVESIDRISTPPQASDVADPDALRRLLSERLDAIHSITTQTRNATGGLQA